MSTATTARGALLRRAGTLLVAAVLIGAPASAALADPTASPTAEASPTASVLGYTEPDDDRDHCAEPHDQPDRHDDSEPVGPCPRASPTSPAPSSSSSATASPRPR